MPKQDLVWWHREEKGAHRMGGRRRVEQMVSSVLDGLQRSSTTRLVHPAVRERSLDLRRDISTGGTNLGINNRQKRENVYLSKLE